MSSSRSNNSGETHTTLRRQLLQSHLRVAALAAFALVLAAVAMQMFREPITTIRLVNVPSANAAMTVQLGLQRSEANLRGWVALKDPALRDNVEAAWIDEIKPAFESLREMSEKHDTEEHRVVLASLDDKLSRLKKLQDWTIEVAAKDGNEPARLVFGKEFGPAREELVSAMYENRHNHSHTGPATLESFFQLRLALSEAEAALGRFVVEGYEVDASTYKRHIKRVRKLLKVFEHESSPGQIPQHLDVLERLSDLSLIHI